MIYRLLTLLLWPVFFVYTLKVARRHNDKRYLKQRLGWSIPLLNTKPIWIHCASVGEVNTLLPLLKLLTRKYPQNYFLVSTNTPTGAATLEKHLLDNMMHCYLPYDSFSSINRFLNCLQPKLAIIMETEIWPQLYKQCNNKNIPIAIVNGRLSAKTLDTNSWVKKLYKKTLVNVDNVFVRSEQDKKSFIKLGADEIKISVVGNLKFANDSSIETKDPKKFTDRNYVLAASTHDDEEYQLATMWQAIDHQNKLLVIAPRHPDRTKSILLKLKSLDLNVAVRSRSDEITEQTDIYLADTLGELKSFIKNAEIVFMGGSLIPHGGQNLLEPALLSKAIVVGPYVHNFQNEVDQFKEKNACIQVADSESLGQTIKSLLANADKRNDMGSAAKLFMDKQANIAEFYVQKIEQYYSSIL
jgi:3-deoxy-D-manno-octulosonic-acid transferase